MGTRVQRTLLRRDQVLDELDIDEDRLEELIDSNVVSDTDSRAPPVRLR